MGTSEERLQLPGSADAAEPTLADQWRWFTRAATLVAILTSPVFFLLLYKRQGWELGWALLATAAAVLLFRGFVDVVSRKVIPWPSLFGADGRLKEEDIVARRRAWYWRKKIRRLSYLAVILGGLGTIVWFYHRESGDPISFWASVKTIWETPWEMRSDLMGLALQLPLFFLINLLIFMGPLLFFSIRQIQGYEPGDADWGVRLGDVRGQAEAKEEISRVISLWQSGEEFERLGGKRERGLLFLGAPGTGKTMMAKAIATGFNCPFVTIPGSGFAQTFIGLDALVVRWMAWRAKRLAAKWGGQCIVFIDEIDAVGMRRASLGRGMVAQEERLPASIHDLCFFGPNGALTPTGDLIVETAAWRERMFAMRQPEPRRVYPPLIERLSNGLKRASMMGGGMFGGSGQQGLQQLLVVMDGVDNPPFMRKFWTNRINTFLDATYVVPIRIGKLKLRMPAPRPAREQIYFIGACNVPIEQLDPALTRPGRMGRHIWFRTPDKDDRKDVLDLYINKVAHDPDLDTPKRREELARVTNGYSPAMIEQVCSMALTYAHHQGRPRFVWEDIVEAMTTVESGMAVNVEYIPELARAIAIHEAGHAAAGHVYKSDVLSTRLSIRKRGDSLGHHQAMQTKERFFHQWRSEEAAGLIWTLGAMAAEHVFYGETSTGVGGDLFSATYQAAHMVGSTGMGPAHVDLSGRFNDEEAEERARERIMRKFESIGSQLMNRSSSVGSAMSPNPIGAVLGDPQKRVMVAQLLGQAFMTAYWLIENNRAAVERIADRLVERREMFGDEVVDMLEEAHFKVPNVDLLDDRSWPNL
jgi:cell division protease FtsH